MWRAAKTPRRCNALPTVWAAIYGCRGELGRVWRHVPGHFGRRTVQHACATCRAAIDASESLAAPARQEHLRDAQTRAGVSDYRTARVTRIGGVPTILR
jgi:hypothetical protein